MSKKITAIIPVAGAGTQLRPHTYSQPKCLIPVAGKPIIGYIIEQLEAVGVNDFVFVIGYLGDKIKDYVDKAYSNIKKQYVFQEKREGLGHAIWLTKDVVKKDQEVIIVLGDTIFETDLNEFVNANHSVFGIKKVDDPRIFGVAEIDEQNNITKVVEKPKIPKSNMALVGLYKIKEYKELISALDHNINKNIKTNNEYLITDAIMLMLKKNIPIKAIKVTNWYDCGQKDILLKTNALLLKDSTKNKSSKKCINSVIIPPVFIGKNVHIENSIIGPNATIGDDVHIDSAIVKDSIIGSFSRLQNIMLYQSLIGNDTSIKSAGQSLNIGDNTELDLR